MLNKHYRSIYIVLSCVFNADLKALCQYKWFVFCFTLTCPWAYVCEWVGLCRRTWVITLYVGWQGVRKTSAVRARPWPQTGKPLVSRQNRSKLRVTRKHTHTHHTLTHTQLPHELSMPLTGKGECCLLDPETCPLYMHTLTWQLPDYYKSQGRWDLNRLRYTTHTPHTQTHTCAHSKPKHTVLQQFSN